MKNLSTYSVPFILFLVFLLLYTANIADDNKRFSKLENLSAGFAELTDNDWTVDCYQSANGVYYEMRIGNENIQEPAMNGNTLRLTNRKLDKIIVIKGGFVCREAVNMPE